MVATPVAPASAAMSITPRPIAVAATVPACRTISVPSPSLPTFNASAKLNRLAEPGIATLPLTLSVPVDCC